MLIFPQDLATGLLLNEKVSTDLVECERFLSTTKLSFLDLWSRQHGSGFVTAVPVPLEMAVMTAGVGNILLLLDSLQ